jgi:AraC family transcriptional activator of pobA
MPSLNVHSGLRPHESLRVGTYRTSGERAQPLTVHPHVAIALVRSGSASVWCGANVELCPNDVLLIPEGFPHAMRRAENLEMLGLAACTSCWREGAGRRLMEMVAEVAEGACPVRRLTAADASQLEGHLLSLGREVEAQRIGWETGTDALLALVHLGLRRASLPGPVPAGSAAWIGRALSFIALHAVGGISLVDVARHVGRSPAYVASTVQAQTGRTVVEWISEARLAAARQWLLHSDASIESLAADVGYPSTSQFYRVFRKTHGMTPRAWRVLHGKRPE